MIIIDGNYHWQVSDLKRALEDVPDDAVVYANFHGEDGKLVERRVYKNSTSEDGSEHYLYLGGARPPEKRNQRKRKKPE